MDRVDLWVEGMERAPVPSEARLVVVEAARARARRHRWWAAFGLWAALALGALQFMVAIGSGDAGGPWFALPLLLLVAAGAEWVLALDCRQTYLRLRGEYGGSDGPSGIGGT